MAETTERYLLPLLQPGQAQKEVTHNEAVAGIDALLHLAVESRTTTVPPAAGVTGIWIVGVGAVGIWSGRAGAVAVATSAGWSYVAPRDGCLAFVKDLGVFAVFTGGAWVSDVWPIRALRIDNRTMLGAEPTALPAVSGGTVVDTQARAALAAIANLLRNMGLATAA